MLVQLVAKAAAPQTAFNPATLSHSQLESVVAFCHANKACPDGPKVNPNTYPVSDLRVYDLYEAYDYCQSLGLSYC